MSRSRPPNYEQLLTSLTELARLFWTLGQRSRWQPSQRSVAMRDRQEPSLVVANWDDVQHLSHVIQGTTVAWAMSAHDHMRGLIRLLERPSRLYAAQSVMRGLLEASARCWYCVDQAVPASERARRTLNENFYSLHEVAVLRESAGVEAVGARDELRQMCEAAQALGFDVKRKESRAPCLGEPRPASTRLSTWMLGSPDGLTFRTSSGVAHAGPMALLRVAGPGSELWQALPDPEGAIALDDDSLHAEYLDAAVAFYKMAVRVSGYFNWANADWDAEFNDAFDVWLRW